MTDYPEPNYQVVRALGLALDARDPLTRHHSDRVARYSIALGVRMGCDKDPHRLESLIAAAFLHDIGVLGVPDGVIQKEGDFLSHEMQQMREHAVIGERILEGSGMPLIAKWVRHHHERVDGKGYPDKLAGDAIPFTARLMAVADAFSAMTTDRPYRKGMPTQKALGILEEGAGTQWDAALVAAFVKARCRAIEARKLAQDRTPPVTL